MTEITKDIPGIFIYFLVFAVLHSSLASSSIKLFIHNKMRWLNRIYRILYNIIAVATLFPLILILMNSNSPVFYVIGQPAALFIYMIKFAAFVLLIVSVLPVLSEISGLSALRQDNKEDNLITTGMYGIARHPIYLFTLIFLWASPSMTFNIFVTYILVTLYVHIGTFFEEFRLVRRFNNYKNYKNNTSRIIPIKWLSGKIRSLTSFK